MNLMVIDPSRQRLAWLRQVAESTQGWRVVAAGLQPLTAVRQLDGITAIEALVVNIDAPYAADVRMWGILRATVNVQRILALTEQTSASVVDFALAMDFSGLQPIPVAEKVLKRAFFQMARGEPAFSPELMEGYRLELVASSPASRDTFPTTALATGSSARILFQDRDRGSVG
ncbi:MAG: hypothetical protein ACLFWD_08640 [Anaerolineales bacterium]